MEEGLSWRDLNEMIDRLRAEARRHAASKSPALQLLSSDLLNKVEQLEQQRRRYDPRPRVP